MFLPGLIIFLLFLFLKAAIEDSKTNSYLKHMRQNVSNNHTNVSSAGIERKKTIEKETCRFCKKEIVYKEEFPSYCPFCGNKIF